ncbi:MAG TPA: hypothetical protein V6C72_05335, partial [Chroococcales cyanobacterium]
MVTDETPGSETAGSTSIKDWQIFLPDRGAWFFVYLMGAFLFARPLLLLWDGGTCRHFLNGLYILAHHQLPQTDYTWAIDPSLPCVTRCWLGDLISGVFFQAAQLNGLVFISSLAIVAGLTWTYQVGRAKGLGLFSGLLGFVIVMACESMHWSARCHLYGYLPMIALYYYVFVVTRRTWKTVVMVAIVMALWANLHGSFTIGMLVLGASFAGHLVDLFRWRGNSARQPELISKLKYDLIMLVTAVAATCINPRGIEFYTTVFNYLSNPLILHKTDEWKAFDIFGGMGSIAFLVLIAVMIWLSIYARKLPDTGELLLSIALIVAGFDAMRLIPYFAVISIAVVGPAWQALKARRAAEIESGSSSSMPAWMAKMLDMEAKAEPDEKSNLKITALAILAPVLMGAVFLTQPFCHVSDFDPERMPVKGVDYLDEHHVE